VHTRYFLRWIPLYENSLYEQKDQSMNFHSDDELGVQNTIAAISLGAPAKMSFRPRKPGAGNAKVCFELILRHVCTFITALQFPDTVEG
jgi:hypothetical protein